MNLDWWRKDEVWEFKEQDGFTWSGGERERMKVGIPEEQDKYTWSGGERGEREDEGWDSRRLGRVYLDLWRERRERMKVGILEEQDGFTWTCGERGERG